MTGEQRTRGGTRLRWTRAGLAILALAVAAGPSATSRAAGVAAKAPAPAKASKASQLDPHVMELVQKMAERIVAAERFRVVTEISWDTVQADGQSIEFGATREVVMQRPDRLRVDTDPREGGKRRLLYDGAQVVLQDLDQNVYAAASVTGPVIDVVSIVAERLGVPVPLAELFSPDLPKLITEKVSSARYVGAETIDGVRCDHVALRGRVGGVELWIGQEDSLPHRVVITYEHDTGRPQFRASFIGWDLTPQITDATFQFEPPQGAEKIAFAQRVAARQRKGSK